MQFQTLVNGQPEQHIRVTDRGLAYGDGLFETARVMNGQLMLADFHWERLSSSARRLSIPLPFDRDVFERAMTHAASDHGLAKLILTRGSGGRGYLPPEHPDVQWIIQGMACPQTPPQNYRDGVTVRSCRLRLSEQPVLAGIKHLNRLEQVLARREWQDPDIFEGLLFNQQDHLIEATCSNVFLLKEGLWHTPSLETAGVAGVLRAAIISHSSGSASPIRQTSVSETDLHHAEAVFICNSVRGILPVRQWVSESGNPLKYWSYSSELASLQMAIHNQYLFALAE